MRRAYWRLVMWLAERSHRRALHRALREAREQSEHAWSLPAPPTPVWHWHVDADGTRHIHVYDRARDEARRADGNR